MILKTPETTHDQQLPFYLLMTIGKSEIRTFVAHKIKKPIVKNYSKF